MQNESIGMLLDLLGAVGFGFTLPVTGMVIPEQDSVFVGIDSSVMAVMIAGF